MRGVARVLKPATLFKEEFHIVAGMEEAFMRARGVKRDCNTIGVFVGIFSQVMDIDRPGVPRTPIDDQEIIGICEPEGNRSA